MKCYECKWLDRSVALASLPPYYKCTLGLGTHHADHECEYEFVPVVRCKDCKWYNPAELCERFDCVNVTNDDYCSYGEREE